jgi:uncharacterized paraquat-inducible protein A
MDREQLKKILTENAKNNINNQAMPSPMQIAKNLAKTAVATVKSVAAGNPVNAPQDVIDNRKNICNSCTFFNKNQDRCTKCGCNMALKTYIKAASCPVGKW